MSDVDWRAEQLNAITEVCDEHGIPTDEDGRTLSPSERVRRLAGEATVQPAAESDSEE